MKNRAGIYAGSVIVAASAVGTYFLWGMAAQYGDDAADPARARMAVMSHLLADSGLDPHVLGPDVDPSQVVKTNVDDDRAVLAEQALLAHLDVESSDSLEIERMFMAGAGATILFGLGGVVQIVRAINSKEDGQQQAADDE